jgi:error-prone DNA polymerase
VRDARDHGVLVLPVDVNASAWDCTLEAPASRSPTLSPSGLTRGPTPRDGRRRPAGDVGPRVKPEDDSKTEDKRLALRLGLRQVKGVKEAEMRRLVERRGAGYRDLAELRRRAGLGAQALDRLARADAFGSLALDRRGAVWQAIGLDRSGRELDPPPLFAWAEGQAAPPEPAVALPAMSEGHNVAEDYASLRLTLRAHPLALLRPQLPRRVIRAEDLARIENGRRVEVAGLVLVRQRPGTASGVIFITIEDESGVANLVVWPTMFERFRKVVLGAQLMVVRGRVQKEGIVIHVVADQLTDRTDLLRRLATAEAPFATPLAHADHVKSSGPPDPRDTGSRRRETSLLEPLEAPVARADRVRPGRGRPKVTSAKAPPPEEPPFAGGLARADEVRRPARQLRELPKKPEGFKSRDFH